MMEVRAGSQPPNFRKLPMDCVLKKEREVLHLFLLLKGEIMQVSDQKEEN